MTLMGLLLPATVPHQTLSSSIGYRREQGMTVKALHHDALRVSVRAMLMYGLRTSSFRVVQSITADPTQTSQGPSKSPGDSRTVWFESLVLGSSMNNEKSSIQLPVWPRSQGTVQVHWEPAECIQRSTRETEVKYLQSKLYYNFTLIFVLPFLPGVNN